MSSPNVPFGSQTNYPEKTPPYSRDIFDWAAENLVGPQGPKGDTGDTGATGAAGADGDDAPQVQIQFSSDSINFHDIYNISADIYIRFSYDDGDNWDVALLIQGVKGDQGDSGDNVKVQYSISESSGFQDTPTSPTNYIRFSLDDGDTWEASYYAVGAKGDTGDTGAKGDTGDTGAKGDTGDAGADGAEAYVYIAYADDDSGTGFTLTFSDSKDYIAILPSDTEIPTPNVGNFTGLWKNYAGIEGDAGQSAYTYVGYASADDGSDFSLTPSDTLDYMAVLATSSYLNPPEQADFAGLWKKTKGNAGTNASYIELPSATTVHGRIVAGIISQPDGWTMDSGDQISNPLSTNPIDLIIYHNTGKEVVNVVVKSKISDRQINLIGAAAYGGWEDDDDKEYLNIKSFCETETIVGIYILFES